MNAFEAGRRGYTHKNLMFWLATLESLVTPVQPSDRVLDFGCGHGLFLPLLFEIQPFLEGVGLDQDQESIDIARRLFADRMVSWPIQYFHTSEAADNGLSGTFDVIFGHEIIWFNADLAALAARTFQLLKPGGRCYFTMGSHPQNPLWE